MSTVAVRWEGDVPAELGGGRAWLVAADSHEKVVAEIRAEFEAERAALLGHARVLVDHLADAWWPRAADALRALEAAVHEHRPAEVHTATSPTESTRPSEKD